MDLSLRLLHSGVSVVMLAAQKLFGKLPSPFSADVNSISVPVLRGSRKYTEWLLWAWSQHLKHELWDF